MEYDPEPPFDSGQHVEGVGVDKGEGHRTHGQGSGEAAQLKATAALLSTALWNTAIDAARSRRGRSR